MRNLIISTPFQVESAYTVPTGIKTTKEFSFLVSFRAGCQPAHSPEDFSVRPHDELYSFAQHLERQHVHVFAFFAVGVSWAHPTVDLIGSSKNYLVVYYSPE